MASWHHTEEYIGKKYNRWTVIKVNQINPASQAQHPPKCWLCQCECGTLRYKEPRAVIEGKSKSCGCLKREQTIKMNWEKGTIPIGTRFGHLVVIEDLGYRIQPRGKRARWSKCRCDCGTEFDVLNNNLKSGGTRSCGCVKSRGETLIRELLIKNNIKFAREYSFPDFIGERGNAYRFDFAIFDKNDKLIELIEFDGRQHYFGGEGKWSHSESLEIIQQRDNIKNNYCQEHNIKLIRIPYYEIGDINLKKLELENYFDEKK